MFHANIILGQFLSFKLKKLSTALKIYKQINSKSNFYLWITFFLVCINILSFVLTPILLKNIIDHIGNKNTIYIDLFYLFTAVIVGKIASEYKFLYFSKWDFEVYKKSLVFFYSNLMQKKSNLFKQVLGNITSQVLQSSQGLRLLAFNFILHLLPILIEGGALQK